MVKIKGDEIMGEGKSELRDVRAVVRYYKDKETGEEKNVYRTVGTAFVSPHESTITVQLEALPIDKDWNGKLYINKPYEKKSEEPEESEKKVEDNLPSDTDMDKPIDLSEIPF